MAEGQFIVDIDNVANGGDGVGRLPDGKAVFVAGTLPDERVRVRVVRSHKTYAHAELLEVVKPSENRRESECPYSKRCGGCQFWHTSYENEFQLKIAATLETLQRIGKWESFPSDLGEHPAPTYTNYRERATLHAKSGYVGFFARNSKEVVDIAHCPVLHNEVNTALQAVRRHTAAQSQRFDALVETDGRGAFALTSQAELELGAETVLASRVVANAPDSLELPAGQFRQSGEVLNHLLVKRVLERCTDARTILELFCGAGNFTLNLARRGQRVLGLEVSEEAVASGREIAEASGVEAEFRVAELPDGLVEALSDHKPDTVLLDPPRTGASEACEILVDSDVECIVYVACDAACFARDSRKLLAGGWTATSLDFVDMFPRTAHLELIGRFERSA